MVYQRPSDFYASGILLRLLCLHSSKHISGEKIFSYIKLQLPANEDALRFYYLFPNINHQQVLQANNACFDYIYIMAITTIPVLIIMSITHLEWLSPGSLLANLLLFAGFVMIWYYMFQDLQPMSDVPAFGSW